MSQCFSKIVIYSVYLDWLNEAAVRYDSEFHDYELMINHIYILATAKVLLRIYKARHDILYRLLLIVRVKY